MCAWSIAVTCGFAIVLGGPSLPLNVVALPWWHWKDEIPLLGCCGSLSVARLLFPCSLVPVCKLIGAELAFGPYKLVVLRRV